MLRRPPRNPSLAVGAGDQGGHPSRRVCVSRAGLALVQTAPRPLLEAPAALPVEEAQLAVLRWAGRRLVGLLVAHALAAQAGVVAAPLLLGLRPALEPVLHAGNAVKERRGGLPPWRRSWSWYRPLDRRVRRPPRAVGRCSRPGRGVPVGSPMSSRGGIMPRGRVVVSGHLPHNHALIQ